MSKNNAFGSRGKVKQETASQFIVLTLRRKNIKRAAKMARRGKR